MTAQLLPIDEAAPSPEAIRACLSRLLADPGFAASPRRRKLLAYVVEQTLAGRSSRLKAFDLAVNVLGRDERFDPQNDPIVRIEVGRLRRDLDHYYADAGRDDPIRISIPKGHYVPAFETVSPIAAPAPAAEAPRRRGFGRRPWHAGAAAACLLLLAVLAWRWAPWQPAAQAAGPAVVVLPFQPLAGGEGAQLLANGLTSELIAELMRFDGMQVFTGQLGASGKAETPAAAVQALTFLVHGTVERAPERVRVTATLTDRNTGQVLWSKSYERSLTTSDLFDVQAELSAAIVGRLAQSYGAISEAAASQLQRNRPETLFAYDCVQRALAYRRTFDDALYPGVRSCLEEAVRRDPDYAAAWAMLAFAHLDAIPVGERVDSAAKADALQEGLDVARRAVELAPDSVISLESLAALLYWSGEIAEAERLQRRAITLSPNNPQSSALLGWRLLAQGRQDEAAELLQKALDTSASPPPWYYANLALARYFQGSLTAARDLAQFAKAPCCGVGYAVLAITEAAVGHAEAAAAALDEAIRQAPLLATDPRAFWANFQATDAVADQLIAGLAKAGLPMTATMHRITPHS
jgi:TolB-like protein